MVEPSEPGVRPCMKCGWLFVSQDILRLGRCHDCKHGEDAYSPRTCSTDQVHGAVRSQYKDTS
jgi:predicted Zn-ribbon and HTH transcriptional regulator